MVDVTIAVALAMGVLSISVAGLSLKPDPFMACSLTMPGLLSCMLSGHAKPQVSCRSHACLRWPHHGRPAGRAGAGDGHEGERAGDGSSLRLFQCIKTTQQAVCACQGLQDHLQHSRLPHASLEAALSVPLSSPFVRIPTDPYYPHAHTLLLPCSSHTSLHSPPPVPRSPP
jgi:hypothetical protein